MGEHGVGDIPCVPEVRWARHACPHNAWAGHRRKGGLVLRFVEERVTVMVLEIGFIITFLTGALNGDLYPVLTSLLCMVVVLIPLALRLRSQACLPWPFTMVAGTVLFLHAAGVAFYFYDTVWWWDILTHTAASVVLAIMIAMALPAVHQWFPWADVPDRLLPLATVLVVFTLGIIWEIAEFLLDQGLGTRMQYSLDDTALDLALDLLGGVIVAVIVSLRTDMFKQASHRAFGPWETACCGTLPLTGLAYENGTTEGRNYGPR